MSNYQSLCHVIDLRLDIEPLLPASACNPAFSTADLQHDARRSLLMNIYAQAAGGAYRMHYSRLSKRAGPFRVHSSFGTCLQAQAYI